MDRVGEAALAPDVDRLADGAAAARRHVAADRHPLVHQCGQGHGPPLADVAEALAVGDAHVSHEHLVELRLTRHLPERSHVDAGRVHVDDEVGHAAVLGDVGVGAGHQ